MKFIVYLYIELSEYGQASVIELHGTTEQLIDVERL